MSFAFRVEIPGLPKGMNGSHGHFFKASAERKKWRRFAHIAYLPVRPPLPLVDVDLVVTRHSSAPMDYDNRVAAAKPIVDALIDAGVILNDSDSVIIHRDYKFQKCPPGKGFIEVCVKGELIFEEDYKKHLDHQVALEKKRLAKRSGSQSPRG